MNVGDLTPKVKQWFDATRKHLDRIFVIVDDPRYYYPLEAGNVMLSAGTIAVAYSEHDIRTASTIILINLWALVKAYKETRGRLFDDLAAVCHRQITILEGWCTKCHQKSDEIHKTDLPKKNGAGWSKKHETD